MRTLPFLLVRSEKIEGKGVQIKTLLNHIKGVNYPNWKFRVIFIDQILGNFG